MRLTWQRCLYVAVDRESTDALTVRAHFTDTGREDHLTMELGLDDFSVRQAVIETPRHHVSGRTRTELDVLSGCVLYLKHAAAARAACARWDNDTPLPARFPAPSIREIESATAPVDDIDREHLAWLLCESITNVFQAEAFLWFERGHGASDQYIEQFHRLFARGCVMYSGQKQTATYSAYTQNQARRDSLFGRHRAARVYEHNTGRRVVTFVCDSFHEIEVRIDVDEHNTIVAADGDFLRTPGQTCEDARPRLDGLPGIRLDPGHRRQLLSVLTGPEGCSHLGDLVVDAALALRGGGRT